MAIAYVSAGTVSTAGGNSTITVALPATVTQGNLLIVFAAMSGRSFSSITQSYTQIASRTTSPSLWIGYKFAGASETAPVLTANGSMSSGSAVIVQYSGVDSLGTTGTISSATATTLATNTLTTTVADEQVISFYEGSYVAANTTFNWTAPGSTTARVTSSQSSTSNGLLIVDETQATAGTTTARTATVSSSAILAAVAVSFKPTVSAVTNGNFFFMMGM